MKKHFFIVKNMNLIEKYILKKGEKDLQPFRLSGEQFSDLLIQYQESIPLVQELYKKVGYWHGTGRFHYKPLGEGRYNEINFEETVDILASIIDKGEIATHDEPWLQKIEGIDTSTVSHTPYRMYARLYACLHVYENNKLKYEFGTQKIWMSILKKIQFSSSEFIYFLISRAIPQLVNIKTYTHIKQFIHALRKPDSAKLNLLKSHLITSDIENNYPILIGIDTSIPVMSKTVLSRLETRTDSAIGLEHITHIEVPLDNVLETKDFLKMKNIALNVIPMEFGEAHCSGCTLQNLVGISD